MKFAQKLPTGIDWKDGSYRVRIARMGVRVDQKFPNLPAALEFRDKTLIAIRGQAFRDNREERTTKLYDLLDRYLSERTAMKVANRKQETLIIKMWQREPWAQLPIVSIRASHITAWRDRRVSEQRAPSTISNAMNCLSKIFKVAKTEWSLDVVNPCTGIARPKKRAHRVAPPSDALENLLVTKALNGSAAWLGYAVRVAAWTALRQSELTALRWSDIDFEKHLIYVWSEEERATKSAARTIPMLAIVEAALHDWLGNKPAGNADWVFPSPVDPKSRIGQVTIVVTFRRLMFKVLADEKKEGRTVPRITFHDLRHYGCTRLAPLHDNAIDLSKTTGHKSAQMLSIYFNPDPAERAKIIRARDAALRVIAA